MSAATECASIMVLPGGLAPCTITDGHAGAHYNESRNFAWAPALVGERIIRPPRRRPDPLDETRSSQVRELNDSRKDLR